MAIPRLLGPALLTLVFYLWDAVHAAAPDRRRDLRWSWQTALLAVLGDRRHRLEPAASADAVARSGGVGATAAFDARPVRVLESMLTPRPRAAPAHDMPT